MRCKTVHLVVILPVAAMALWLLLLNIPLMQAQEVTLAVTGYDPRDLLSGHYLRYRVDYGVGFDQSRLSAGQLNEDFCACLTPDSSGISKASWIGRCVERHSPTCPIFVKGKFSRNGLDVGIERYYIPEHYQYSLAQVPAFATIKARVTSKGTAYVTGMYVNDIPILEWAKQKS